MSRRLYELAGADAARRFSPYAWRSRRALVHKGLAFDTEPVRFTEKEKIAFSGQKRVPVLVDGARVVPDSWAIARHLDDTYADRPPLMEGVQARALTFTLAQWVQRVVHPALLPVILMDIFAVISDEDRNYFRQSRERAFGRPLEAVHRGEAGLPAFRESLAPARATLESQPFLAGETPAYADHVLAGAIDWGCNVTSLTLLAADDPVRHWYDRLPEAAPSRAADG
ncbi:MAG: glutathione S-transferase N-terminal domain-containing protein [Geminicoccaceae bacterium]|nr:glutathione S-transferase N-terminal domain-containing protein [Geminicoccaceae bacterium]